MRTLLSVLLACLSLALLGPAWAADGDLDPSFDPGVGVGFVPSLWGQVYYNDLSGKFMVTGSFTEVGGHAGRAVARIQADGSVDTSFTSPVTVAWVNHCFLLSPGDANSQMLIAGPFEVPSDSGTYYGLARLNANGTVDSTFPHTFSGPCPGMSGIAVQTDGKILVGGYALPVTGYPGTTYYCLRLNAGGTVDDTYPMRSAPGAFVRSFQVYPSSDPTYPNYVRLFGAFPRFSDPTHTDYMVLLAANGTSVMGSIGDEIINGAILQMWIQGDGKILLVGAFNQVYGVPTGYVARLNPTGGVDSTFAANIGAGANGFVQRVTIDNNKIMLNGIFSSFNGVPRGCLVRLNLDGTVDTTFDPGTGADDRIWNVNKRSDNTWVALGSFQNINGTPRHCLANLAQNGALNPQYSSFNAALTVTTARVTTLNDTYQGLYFGGNFTGYQGKYYARLGRLKFDGTVDPTFKSQFDGTVKDIRTLPDGKILVSGSFGNVWGYTPRTGLARLNQDGSPDPTFKPIVVKADGTFGDIAAMDRQDNGQIMIGGDFSSVNGVARSSFARLNADGSLDPTFNAQITIPGATNIRVNGGGNGGGVSPDSKYTLGGYCLYQESPAGFATRLTSTGDLDTTFGPSGGPAPHVILFNGELRTGMEQPDGKLILGGDFTEVMDGSPSPPQVGHLARFTVDGLFDNTFPAAGANGAVYYMEKQWTNNKILLGGDFTSFNGVGRNRIARLNPDGTLDTSFDPGAGANAPVYAIRWDDYTQRAMLGGSFSTYQGVNRARLALIYASGATFNPAIPMLLLFP